jgi:uroporphyrinogen decarboxylase
VSATMTKRERLRATGKGDPVDRPAVTLWRHFPGDDQRAGDLAAATVAWQAQYDWDFIKVSPSSSFCLVDWGVEDRWVGGDEGTREYTRRVIHRPEDWGTLPVLDPRGADGLKKQLRCLELIAEAVGQEIPFIQTIFSPLAQAKNLAGSDRLLSHLRQAPDLLRAGLETITETTIRFVEACARTGIAGVYYAASLANYELMSEAEYRAFGEPNDRRILAAAGEFWFNMVHLHGSAVMFDLVASYPAQALNWHDREGPPSLAEGMRRFPGAVSGGLARWDDLLRGDPDGIRARSAEAIQQTGGRRLILSSGCVAPVNAPFSNLRAVRQAVERETSNVIRET